MQIRKNKNILFLAAILLSHISAATDETPQTFQDTEMIDANQYANYMSYDEQQYTSLEDEFPEGYSCSTIPQTEEICSYVSEEADLIKDADCIPTWAKYLYNKKAMNNRNSLYSSLSGFTFCTFLNYPKNQFEPSSNASQRKDYIDLVGLLNLCIAVADNAMYCSFEEMALKEKASKHLKSINQTHFH